MKAQYTPIQNDPVNKYPFLGEYRDKNGSFIVLFTSTGSGVVVDDPDNIHGVGHADDTWNMTTFQRITGSVQLTFDK